MTMQKSFLSAKDFPNSELLTWRDLISFLHPIKNEDILNTTVASIEHHHYVHIRFFPEFETIDDSPVLIPRIESMYNFREWNMDIKSPYHKRIHELVKKYPMDNFPKGFLTYKQILDLESKIPQLCYTKPIGVLDIWDDLEVIQTTDMLCHFGPSINVTGFELATEIQEIKDNTHRTTKQKILEIQEIEDRMELITKGDLVNTGIDYHIDHLEQPILGFSEF